MKKIKIISISLIEVMIKENRTAHTCLLPSDLQRPFFLEAPRCFFFGQRQQLAAVHSQLHPPPPHHHLPADPAIMIFFFITILSIIRVP